MQVRNALTHSSSRESSRDAPKLQTEERAQRANQYTDTDKSETSSEFFSDDENRDNGEPKLHNKA